MLQKPSAGKAALMGRGDEAIWDAWMAIEPFVSGPPRSQLREEGAAPGMVDWAIRPRELAGQIKQMMSGATAEDLAPARIRGSALGRHSLETIAQLLDPDGKGLDIVQHFYLAKDGARRTALLHALVGSMTSEADAAAAAWTSAGHVDRADGGTARALSARLLQEQTDLLKKVVFEKMAVPARPGIDWASPSGIEGRLGSSIMGNLQTAVDAVRSPAGFVSLIAADKVELRSVLGTACAATMAQGAETVGHGYPAPVYTEAFFTTMCCFSPCPPLEQREQQAQTRNQENKQRADELRTQVINLRSLMQKDLAKAIGLFEDMKKT